jgi:hypothetical protein
LTGSSKPTPDAILLEDFEELFTELFTELFDELDNTEDLEELDDFDELRVVDDLEELTATDDFTELMTLDDEDLIELGALDEATEPQAPKSVHVYVHAQPMPGSYGPPIVHHPPSVQA